MEFLKGLCAAAAMIVLILDSKCAFAGATEGIELCIRTVIPTLFPFFMLSNILVSSFHSLPRPILRIFGVSRNAGGVLLTGLLGGYPVGAQSVSQAYGEGRISKGEAERLLPVCNQCGPAFIFGMTAALFRDIRSCILLWLLQLASAVIVAWVIPGGHSPASPVPAARRVSISDSLRRALAATATVCGWIVMFRLLFSFLERWMLWALPQPFRIGICGLLELANGCTELHQIGDERLRFLLCVLMMSFGGLCVTMQTFSVIHPDLDRRYYFPGKLLQASLCIQFASLLQGRYTILTGILGVIGAICVIFFRFKKKTVAFRRQRVYNGPIKDTRILLCSSEKR